MEDITLESILKSSDFNFIINTLIAFIFVLSLFKAIQAISILKSSGSSPAKRAEGLKNIYTAAVYFFIDGIFMSVKISDFLTDLVIKSTVFETNSELATNQLLNTFMFFARLGTGLTFLSIVATLIAGTIRLASSSDNPKMRVEATKGLLWSLIAVALLGSITTISVIFINVGIIGGV